MKRLSAALGIVVLAVSLAPVSARADYQYNVTIDASSLTTGTYTVAFALADANSSGLVGDANNTVSVSNFNLTNATLGSPNALYQSGGYSGDLSSTMSLNDTAPFNLFGQDFATSNTTVAISFLVTTTTNIDANGGFDGFSVGLVDSSGNSPSTTDPSGANNLVFMQIDGNPPSVTGYGSPVGDTPVITVKITPQSVPEPASLALFGLGLGVVGLSKRLRKRRAA